MARTDASGSSNSSSGSEVPFPHWGGGDQKRETGFGPDLEGGPALEMGMVEANSAAQISSFLAALRQGQDWFEALLECIRDWEAPRETIGGREYVYLIEQEAFDWLLLAERICDSAPGMLPRGEVESLLLDESPPLPLSEAEFQQRLGTSKYWAHLNFLYGVRVEQALQLAIERVVQKERSGLAFSHAREELDADVFGRIYGSRQADLLREYRATSGREGADPERIEHAEWQAFTYWLFRRRLERQDPARVASDTRQGLEMLYELEVAKQRRRRRQGAMANPIANEADVIDGVLVAVG